MSACFGTSHLTPCTPRPVLGLRSLSSLTTAASSARPASSVSLWVITVKTMRPKLPQSLPSTQQGPNKPLIPSCFPLRWGAWEPVLLRGREEQGESQGWSRLVCWSPARENDRRETKGPHGQQLASLAASHQAPPYLQGSAPVCGTDSFLSEAPRPPETPQRPTRGSPFCPPRDCIF